MKRNDYDNRLEIVLDNTLPLHELSKIIIKSLIDNNCYIFNRGSCLVIIYLKPDYKIVQIKPYILRNEISKFCKFKLSKASNKEIFPPMEIVQDVLASGIEYFPNLKGVIRYPFFLSNGSIVYETGYNKETELFIYNEQNFSFLEINNKEIITEDELFSAKNTIYTLISDFPFYEKYDIANFISLLLTTLCQPFIMDLIPLFLIKSSTPGTGKTLLVKITNLILIGKLPSITILPESESELRKSIFTYLLNCSELIVLDNAKEKISSATLAAVLTSGRYKGRILQKSECAEMDVNVPIIVTANNPDIDKEIARRTVLIELLSNLENPASRKNFKLKDIKEHILINREKILYSLLLIIKHWFLCNMIEENNLNLGSFEKWTRTIGGILENANIDGFLGNFNSFFNDVDIENDVYKEFLFKWYEIYNNEPKKSSDLVELAKEIGFLEKNSSAVTLGKLLSKKVNMIVKGLTVKKSKNENNTIFWKVEKK